MTNTPFISVVIPVYNVEKYFDKCMQSVLNQTYKNLEIILVDDGSTDESGRMCDMYAAQDDRVRVVHKENGGVSAARNDALRIATGQWIGFVDADDYIDEKMYETMVVANQNENADIISCGYYLTYEDRNVLAENKNPVPTTAVDTKEFFRYIYERDVYKGVASYLWTRLLSRDLLYDKNNNLITTFATDLDVSEDLVFLAEVILRSKKSLYIEKPMYYYLQREDSSCHDEKKQLSKLSWIRAYLKILEIFDKNPIDKAVYNLIVRMMVFRCGKFMELAVKYQQKAVYDELKEIVEKYYSIYKKANEAYPDRIEWLDNVLDAKTISVVVPLYKGNTYVQPILDMVEKNIECAHAKSCSLFIEVLFINDYPEEQVTEVDTDKLVVKYYQNEKNSGIHQTRVNGIKKATGKYVHVFDQDDGITEDFYYSQIATIQENDVAVCNGLYRGTKRIFSSEKKSFEKQDLIQKGCIIVSPGHTLIRKEAIPMVWFQNIVQNSGCDDWLLWILMVYENASFVYNPNISYMHVEDGNNQSFHWDKMSASLKEIKEILSKQNAEDALKEQSLKCIDKFIFNYDSFYAFEKEWKSIGKEQIKRFFDANKIHTVAIYGYGNIGKKIVATLKECGVNIWAIDRDLRYVEEEITIYRPEDELPEADLMVVTPLRGGEEVRQRMVQQLQTENVQTVDEFISII